ncbi:aminoglycoside phosphotransferase family protein [Pseudogracilibacillus auburnensis]|uniref:aminoglycoside phosphotransferase family protein n=1 Tax=Pseudogracilibacillus auburnensis TaxID=1494959 RepID=UPI001A957F75|nr:aminoglycoside phosphotransferase family protein [Pseudogracilibacillus auburnensis]MBO1004844.1 aminoglycoside phosphotransferase family protein [Pseudogracilibacillus auburnensis]
MSSEHLINEVRKIGIYSEYARVIAYQYLKEEIINVDSIIGKGSVNKIYLVQSNHVKVIVRMNADVGAFNDYQKEQWCMKKAAELGIPSPSVFEIGRYKNITYMIQSFVEGRHGEDKEANKLALWKRIGEYSKKIHSVKTTGFGENLIDLERGIFQSPSHDNFDGTWPSFVQYNIDSLTDDDELLKLGVITVNQSKKAKHLFKKLLDRKFSFGLNHGDLSLKNTLIDQDGTVTLLDWGCAEVNIIPHGDILQLIQGQIENDNPSEEELQAFLDGYGHLLHHYPNLQDELNELLLIRAFDKLRWAIDRHPPSIPHFVAYAKKVTSFILN